MTSDDSMKPIYDVLIEIRGVLSNVVPSIRGGAGGGQSAGGFGGSAAGFGGNVANLLQTVGVHGPGAQIGGAAAAAGAHGAIGIGGAGAAGIVGAASTVVGGFTLAVGAAIGALKGLDSASRNLTNSLREMPALAGIMAKSDLQTMLREMRVAQRLAPDIAKAEAERQNLADQFAVAMEPHRRIMLEFGNKWDAFVVRFLNGLKRISEIQERIAGNAETPEERKKREDDRKAEEERLKATAHITPAGAYFAGIAGGEYGRPAGRQVK